MAIKRDKILKNAEKLVQKGKLEQAIREYEKLLKATPDDTNTVNRLGDLYGRVGEVDKAVSLYEQVAEGFADQGFLPKAIAIYKKINRLAPQRLDIFERLGDLYIEQGLTVEAKSQFRMLAEHYAKNDDVDSAIRAHQRLSEIDPSDSTTRLKFADMLLESGNAEDAMSAYSALGESLIQQGQLDEAERLFRRLLEQEMPDGDVMAPVCAKLLDAGRVTSAQELLTAGLKCSPQSIPLRTLQVRAFMSLGESDAAVDLAKEILEVDPDNPAVRGLVGNAMISDGDQEEATEMMIPAAEALLEKADYSRAQKMLRELVEIAPMDERILRLAIRAFRPSGDQEILTRLTASLADVCFSNGQEDQAKRFYLELVATDPTNELYRERLALLDGAVSGAAGGAEASGFGADVPSEISFAIDGDELEAESVEADPVVSDSATFDPAERINEAAVFTKYGLNDKAVTHLEDVVARAPDHEGARQALAKAYLAVGQRDKASTTIAPVINKLRTVGDDLAALELEKQFGASSSVVEEDDDEVIIVEIDGDEDSDVGFDQDEGLEDVASDVVDITDVNIEEMVANAMGDLDLPGKGTPAKDPVSATDDLLADVLKSQVDHGDSHARRAGGAPDGPIEVEAIEAEPVDEDFFVEEPVVEEPVVEEPIVEEPVVEEPVVEEPVVEEPVVEEPIFEEPVVEESVVEESVVEDPVEDELVEEELVEISTGVQGPSFNELAQLDLFIDQELFDDAMSILGRLEGEFPDDSDLVERRERLAGLGAMDQPAPAEDAAEVGPTAELVEVADGAARVELSQEPEPVETPPFAEVSMPAAEPVRPPDDIFGEEEEPGEYFDLARELEEELAEEEAMVEEATGRGKGEALLDEVFKEFQKGVAEQLSDEDSDTHFNLGIAYKEMGLIKEAIGEFKIASHDPAFFVEACSMIGVCANELSRHDEAAEWYQKALVAPDLSLDARTALRYELAAAFEKSGKLEEATNLYGEIQTADPGYRDVGDRLSALTQQRQVN